jgi:hypothetical protein
VNRGPSLATLIDILHRTLERYREEGSAPRKDATKRGQILNIVQNMVKSCQTFENGSNLSKSTLYPLE